jgi:hypothetical protein
MPPSLRLAPGVLAAGGLLAALAACAPAGRPDLTSAVSPAEITYAVCAQSRSGDEASCNGLQSPDRASEVAYSVCLDYHKLDPEACKALRETYAADLRAYLAAPHDTAQPPEPPAGADLAGRGYAAQHRTAEQMYIATSRDAQTFEAALLIPEVRRKVDRLLGPNLADDKLRAMADKSQSEARYWYGYMQSLEREAGE